jgi:hypothetical protein
MQSTVMKTTVWACLAAAAAATAGCTRQTGPSLARAGGIVLYDGEPLAGATVSFVPDGSKGTSGRMAIGSTGTDGRFTLRSFAPGDGAIVGFHCVTVVAMDLPEMTPDPEGKPRPLRQPQSWIPVRYNDPASSGLVAEVRANIVNAFEFRLTSEK